MEAYALIESSFNPAELVVVGRTDMRTPRSRAADGFFMKLNSNNGAIITYTTYERMFSGDEWISAVDHAFSTYGGSDGFIIGGRSHYPPSPTPPFTPTTIPSNTEYTPWMAKLNQNGAVIWSTLIRPSTFVQGERSAGDISSVFERLNASGSYEYYAAANRLTKVGGMDISTNLIVFRLDDAGSDATYNQDEFHYTDGTGTGSLLWIPPYSGAFLTKIDSSSSNSGFQAFGTKNLNSLYFVKSYFNGYSGCYENIYNIDSIARGPDSVSSEVVEPRAFNACGQSKFNILGPDYNFDQFQVNCSNPSIGIGSNSRVSTDIDTNASKKDFINISTYPNPVFDKAKVLIQKPPLSISWRILNVEGKEINLQILNRKTEEDKQTFELDFKNSNLTSGIYLLEVLEGVNRYQKKIYYTPNN